MNIMRILDAPWLDQREKWPTGCESVTATLALRTAGIPADPDFFIDRCLPTAPPPRLENGVWRGPDPRRFYPGDPRTPQGWGCFAPAVRQGIETFAALTGARIRVRELYGKTFDELLRGEIDEGRPVILFATMGMAPPRVSGRWMLDGTGYVSEWKTPIHCLRLIVYYGEDAVFSDPLASARQRYPRAAAEHAYRGMGAQAVVAERV